MGDDLTETRDALRALTPAKTLPDVAQAVQELSCHIVELIGRVDACDARLDRSETIGRGLAELLLRLARQRVANPVSIAAIPASRLDTLSHEITAIRQTEEKIEDLLQIIDGALAHIVKRLSVIEARMHSEAESSPESQSPRAVKADRFASAAPTPADVPIALQQSAAPMSASAPTPCDRPLDPMPSSDDALGSDSSSARGLKSASRGDHVPPSASATAVESATRAVTLSVMPGLGGRSDLIAAARRAARAASGGVVISDDAPAVRQIDLVAPTDDSTRPRVLIGATAAIVIVLGLLQIAAIPLRSADETTLIIPGYTSIGPDVLPDALPGLASLGEPAVVLPGADPFLAGSTPDPEATGKVRLPPPDGARETTATAFTGSASVTPGPAAVSPDPDLATLRPAQ